MIHPYSYYPARAARHWPDKIALIEGDRSLTYAELNKRARAFASALNARGLRPGARVAVIQHNCLEYVVAVIGIARAGGVLTPMLGALTEKEHAFIVADSDARFVIALTPAHYERGRAIVTTPDGALGLGVFAGESDLSAPAKIETAPPLVDRCPAELAQILYTSGTTGRPKGVTHSYASVAAAMNFWAATFRHTPEDRLLGQLPLSHFCGRAMDSAWIGGAALVILPSAEPRTILDAIGAYGVTFMLTVPTALRMLLDDPAIETAKLGSLRTVVYAAAPAAPSLVERAMKRLGPVLHTGYGQTEAYGLNTLMAPAEHADAVRLGGARLTSVGREYANAQIRIVDADGNPCAPGEVGEICLCTPWNTPGFWRRPDLDAERLRNGWLHTGDFARMDKDGYIYLADRKEDMIITGGYNVYPAEVENAILAHEAVAECGVFSVPDAKWGEAVYAAVVLRPGAQLSEGELIAFAKANLAKFKVPKTIKFMDALPKTAVGKTLRRILREPYWEGRGSRIHGAN
ncbi:MAG: AMP-binding protein [Hyphomonadaceae bacterium]|nr:AMP-binding protein [Hyphomonadaceae bacterium]